MQQQVFELRMFLQKTLQHAIAKKIRNLVPVANRMQALERDIVGVIASLASVYGPIHERMASAIPYFLLLLIEDLLWHFLPHKCEVTRCRHHAQANGFAPR